jgi:hypothetical protein
VNVILICYCPSEKCERPATFRTLFRFFHHAYLYEVTIFCILLKTSALARWDSRSLFPEQSHPCSYSYSVAPLSKKDKRHARPVSLLAFNTRCACFQYCSGDQIKKNEVGGACSTYG